MGPKKDIETLVFLAVDTITPAEYNPRAISDGALEGLKESIRRFGLPQPLVVNRRSGRLVSGHQRLRAARELGMDKVPVVYVDLTDEQEKALNVTLNNQHITGFFTEQLEVILGDIKVDLGMEAYSTLRLDALEIPNNWATGTDQVEKTEANLDGITVTIKVTCPQKIADQVRGFLKGALQDAPFDGVAVV